MKKGVNCMVECQLITPQAETFKDNFLKHLKDVNKTLKFTETDVDTLLTNILKDFNRTVFKIDDDGLQIFLNEQDVEVLCSKQLNAKQRLSKDTFSKNKKYSYDKIYKIVNYFIGKGNLSNGSRLKAILQSNNVKVEVHFPENQHSLKDLAKLYENHVWYLSKESSLNLYFDLCLFLKKNQTEVKPITIEVFENVVEFLHKSASETFYIVGEIDVSQSVNTLPAFIQIEKYDFEELETYFQRFEKYINSDKWFLSNSFLEMLNMLKYITEDSSSNDEKDYSDLFKKEMFSRPIIRDNEYRLSKYEGTQLGVIPFKESNYPFEFIKGKRFADNSLKVAYTEVVIL